jgi:hypothetical protein
MKMKRILFFPILLLFIGCVKESTEINPEKLFSIKVNGVNLDSAKIIGNKFLRYTIEIETLENVEIDDGKQLTVSVSDGVLQGEKNLKTGTTSNTIPISITGGKATIFYTPSFKQEDNVIISITVENLTQFHEFKIIPSEPSVLKLNSYSPYPKKSDDIEVTATLLKQTLNDTLCSENLRIDFECYKFSVNDSIVPTFVLTDFSYSKYDETLNLITAKNKITTNKVPGKIKVIAKYQNLGRETKSDTIIVEFKP